MKGYRPVTLLLICAAALTMLGFVVYVAAQGAPDGKTTPAAAAPAPLAAQPGTVWTFQGRLHSGGSAADGLYEFQFGLWDEPLGGTQIGVTLTQQITVADGLFTVGLDFGPGAHNGEARWLAIAVRPAGGGSYTGLSGRQALTAAPLALALPGLWTQQHITSPNLIGGYAANEVVDGAVGAAIGGGGAPGLNQSVADDYGTVGGGQGNLAGSPDGVPDNALAATVAGGEGNAALGAASTVGGGSGNAATADAATVGGGVGNVVTGTLGTVGGGSLNQVRSLTGTVSGGANNYVVGAGGAIGGGADNNVYATYGTVAGGESNTAQAMYDTVGGGSTNTVSATYGTVAGGANNTASGTGATIAGGILNTAPNDYATIGGGQSNYVQNDYATIAGGNDNWAWGQGSAVGGGTDNQAGDHGTVSGGELNIASASHATVGGGYNNRALASDDTVGGGTNNLASGGDSTVAGGNQNSISAGRSTIAGGYQNVISATAQYATIGGGADNSVGGILSTISGGAFNTVTALRGTIGGGGAISAANPDEGNAVYDEGGTIGGGGSNIAGSDDGLPQNAYWATIAGGWDNEAAGKYAVVGGGQGNVADGIAATVPGGWNSEASGDYSFAAGCGAQANHHGSFVWADALNCTAFASEHAQQFRVRAWGGAQFTDEAGNWVEFIFTQPITTSTGAYLSFGGTWTNASDAALKHRFAAVDAGDVLETVAALPLHAWSYKAEDAGIRHLGPTAQDFYAAFGLGEDETHISTVDADGVALAAIQGLHAVVSEQETVIAAQEGRIASLEAQLAAQDERLARLEAAVGGEEGPVTGGFSPTAELFGVFALAALAVVVVRRRSRLLP